VSAQLGDWTPEEIEREGREVLALIREHFEGIDELPVLTSMSARDLNALFEAPPPEDPIPFEVTLAETREKVIPNLTHWNHPNFFAYFAVSSSGPGILAETLVAALNVQAMIWKSGPAANALETVMLRWIARMIGYEEESDGVLINGASLATMYALVAAREATDPSIRERGMAGRDDLAVLRVYTSEHAHSSIDKAMIALGLGLENLVKISGDENFAMRADELAHAIDMDINAGRTPMAVMATAGTTSTGAVDPIKAVADICERHGVWFHLDAAYGGFYNVIDEVRSAVGPFALADSVVANPHKGLFTPLEVTALLCKRRGVLPQAFSIVPPGYLTTVPEEGAVDYMAYSLQLGRQFRALKLWWVIRTFGLSGLRARMQEGRRLAAELSARVRADDRFIEPATSPYALVTLQAQGADDLDALNMRVLERVNATGERFLSHTVLPGVGVALRVSVGNIRTEDRHIDALWDALVEAVDAETA
jgi:aromatic-L-amino-acid/L-tryptophan decarboxylase